ncbi:hypothetical protein T261_03918 [Streptomyces lydicus]|nr:hypothetical protein T261_03918 [Streptomyces lydicus]
MAGPGLGGRPSGSGGPLGLGHPAEAAVGIAGRLGRAPPYPRCRAELRLEAARRSYGASCGSTCETCVRHGKDRSFARWWGPLCLRV